MHTILSLGETLFFIFVSLYYKRLLFFPLDKARFNTRCGDKSQFLSSPARCSLRLDSTKLDSSKVYRCNLSSISLERSSPVSILWQSPLRLSSQPPTERPHVFPSNERAGAAAVIFRFYYLYAQPRSRPLGDARAHSRLRLLRLAQVVMVSQYEARSCEERISFPGKNTLTFIAFSLRAQLVIDSHFRRGSTPSDRTQRQGHSIENLK